MDTGLMEPDNPESGTIGSWYFDEDDLVAVGLIRGWEKFARTPDGAVMLGHVFVFEDVDGPLEMVDRFEESAEPGDEHFDVAGVPGGVGFSQTSPDGNDVYTAAAAQGRFLIGFTVGGEPGEHDYAALLESLMQEQFEALPDS